MAIAHDLAGAEQRVVKCCYANEHAMPFYEKLGMRQSTDVMDKDHVAWTSFTAGRGA